MNGIHVRQQPGLPQQQDGPHPDHPARPQRPGTATGLACALLLVAILLALIAPTLPWLELAQPEENVNVATALEIRWTGNWLLPTLAGIPRLVKPPLTAWVTAAPIRPATLQHLASADPSTHRQGLAELARDIRLPAAAAMCLLLLATYELGRVIAGIRLGLIAMAICAGNHLFARYVRTSITDVQLALWVAISLVFLAHAVLRRRWWIGCIGAGIAMGLAIMAKGPLVLLQALLPVMLYCAWEKWGAKRRDPRPEFPGGPAADTGAALSDASQVPALEHAPMRKVPIVLGLALMLLVGLWWYVWVGLSEPTAWVRWVKEATRYQANDLRNSWTSYLRCAIGFLPWSIWLAAGAALGLRALWDRRSDRRLLVLLLWLVPLAVMQCFHERKERYLVPLLPAASILAAWAVDEYLRQRQRAWPQRGLGLTHWAVTAGLVLGLPLAGAMGLVEEMTEHGGTPALPLGLAVGFAATAAVLLGIGLWACRRRPAAMVLAAVVVLTGVELLHIHSTRRSEDALPQMAPLADLIWQRYPQAQTYSVNAPSQNMLFPPAAELAIHAGRVVRWANTWEDVPQSDGPQIVIMAKAKGQPDPIPPQPWRLLWQSDSRRLLAYIRWGGA